MALTTEKPELNNVDEVIYAYISQHNKECDYYLTKCRFNFVFNHKQFSIYVKSNLFDNKTLISWSNFLENVIDDFKNKGYFFNHIAEMNIITNINKRHMSYDFYIEHNMCASEWKLNAMINKNNFNK